MHLESLFTCTPLLSVPLVTGISLGTQQFYQRNDQKVNLRGIRSRVLLFQYSLKPDVNRVMWNKKSISDLSISYWFMKWRMSAVLRGHYLRDLRITEYQSLLLRNEWCQQHTSCFLKFRKSNTCKLFITPNCWTLWNIMRQTILKT